MVTIYELALAKTYGIGIHTAKGLMKRFGSAKALFEQNRANLELVLGKQPRTINEIINRSMFPQCEKELEFMQRYGINSFFFLDENYPQRLSNISDPPIVFFSCGNINFNISRNVGIVGSRKITEYGKRVTNDIVESLKKYDVTIISGLAYGADAAAHQAALNNGLQTFGVLAHGLDMIYPRENFELAQKMKANGGLITEQFTKTKISPALFPLRNRIIAGLSDLIIVVEAAYKSGALITARLANDYNREVFAVPGRLNDENSAGCNALIYKNLAHILSRFSEISYLMNWNEETENQPSLFDKSVSKPDLPALDAKIYKIIEENEGINIDDLSVKSSMTSTQLASALLNLEMDNFIISLPGKCYKTK
ncbi:MAG: DNA-processing protein DprA [Bacteroidales bacterium]|jgi:DNA processing protein|nr:DNA-processing protein DprA [Bacteroidales bacterium]